MPDLGLGDVYPRPFDTQGSSFADVLRRTVPEATPEWMRGGDLPADLHDRLVEGTTVLATLFADGVVIAGDRRATSGNLISKTDMRKVFPADHHSAIAIAGTAGPAMELARVLSTELEHYEKVEGDALSLEGKSNKLAAMVRANLPLAMQGLVVVPLFAGVDVHTATPGIFEYDPVGGRYAARRFAAVGSGSIVARQTLRHGFRADAAEEDAVALGIAALFDAAEQDSATGGPDLVRRIYPIVAVVDADGYRELDEDRIRAHVDEVVDARTDQD